MSYIPNDLTLDATVSNTRIQQNFVSLDALVSGGLTQNNLSPSAAIPLSNLANHLVEETLVFNVLLTAALTAGGKASVRLMGTSIYTIQGVHLTWAMGGGTPASGNSATLQYGTYSSGTGFTSSGNIFTTTPFYGSAAAVTGETDISSSVATLTAPTTLVLTLAISGTPPTSGFLTVTVRVTRDLI